MTDEPEGPPSREPSREDEDPSTAAQLGRYTGHGLTLAASTAFFTWVGDWLDERLGTAPVLVIVGAFVGFGAGFYSMYRQLVSPPSDSKEKPDPPDSGPEAPRGSAGPG